jgi:hypothetical protein
MARSLETAAQQFKSFWEGGCKTPVPSITPLLQTIAAKLTREEVLKALDPAFVALLQAMGQGDDAAVPRLAEWLEQHGDSRAPGIRKVTEWAENMVREARVDWRDPTTTGGEPAELGREPRPRGLWLGAMNGGKVPAIHYRMNNKQAPLAEFLQEVRRGLQIAKVWGLLGLTGSQRSSLMRFLGVSSTGIACSVEEIAQSEDRKVTPQTIRSRIALAMHNLMLGRPAPSGC